MVKFINYIICCLIADILDYEETSQKALSASFDKIDRDFTLKLYQNGNSVTSITPIHFFLYDATYFI